MSPDQHLSDGTIGSATFALRPSAITPMRPPQP